MSSGTKDDPVSLLSPNSESSFSDGSTLIYTPPSGTKEDPIDLLSDSEDESTTDPASPSGSSKRPITLSHDDDDDEAVVVVVEDESQEEAVIVEKEDNEEVVILKVDEGDGWYDGTDY